MNYIGVIIEESLKNTDFLQKVKVLETIIEAVTSEHKTPWLNKWTLHKVEIPEDTADQTAEVLSGSFDNEHPDWYADFKNNKFHFIIFSGKVFKVDLAQPVLYLEAKKFGASIGIPDYQLDFTG